ncbi:hypothetical protein [Streptomyces sp. NPDC002328]|uniref:hypothetical protein n=1 Tax=Streptomyces sp. NPDC002328 TaxID=3364642 RepID=UPI0036739E4E
MPLELRTVASGRPSNCSVFGPAVEVLEPMELPDALVRRTQETIALNAAGRTG